ncbi:MAG TPA: MFS transporter [Streptosporangiaceae bacterium]
MQSADFGADQGRPTLNQFRNAPLFWVGILLAAVGTGLHFPLYIASRSMHYQVSKMSMTGSMGTDMVLMDVGMGLILAGLVLSFIGLIPRRRPVSAAAAAESKVVSGETRVTATVVQLMIVLAVAIVIDATHPLTLSFVAPGMVKEYGLKAATNPHGGLPVSLLPLVGITGTVIGSFTWGWLGDRIGRRASIVMAGELFMTTAICGAMPAYQWNLVMCFLMGIGAGGMIPITFTMIAESVPTRHRGWLMVLIGGEVLGAYALVSWQAGWLIPHWSWRIMWLIGMPTGALLILLSRWIPESPRFLLAYGRVAEAQAVMHRFGMKLVEAGQGARAEIGAAAEDRGRFSQLWARGLAGQSLAIVLLGAGIGFVTYGFQLWIPSDLQQIGFSNGATASLLRNSALIGYPFTLLAAVLYGFWSSKKTILILTVLTIVSLAVFVVGGNSLTSNKTVFLFLLAVPILATAVVTAVISAYSSEVYPTLIRARGGGLAAGATKAGGVLIIALVAASLASPSMRTTALIGLVPMVLALGAVFAFGTETRKRQLEEISADLLVPVTAGGPVPGQGS